jgi:hypothetical protein
METGLGEVRDVGRLVHSDLYVGDVQFMCHSAHRRNGVNAEFRHYLACLARRSRCFPRCPRRLALVLRLFISALNRRQLYRLRYPNYPARPRDSVYP